HAVARRLVGPAPQGPARGGDPGGDGLRVGGPGADQPGAALGTGERALSRRGRIVNAARPANACPARPFANAVPKSGTTKLGVLLSPPGSRGRDLTGRSGRTGSPWS